MHYTYNRTLAQPVGHSFHTQTHTTNSSQRPPVSHAANNTLDIAGQKALQLYRNWSPPVGNVNAPVLAT